MAWTFCATTARRYQRSASSSRPVCLYSTARSLITAVLPASAARRSQFSASCGKPWFLNSSPSMAIASESPRCARWRYEVSASAVCTANSSSAPWPAKALRAEVACCGGAGLLGVAAALQHQFEVVHRRRIAGFGAAPEPTLRVVGGAGVAAQHADEVGRERIAASTASRACASASSARPARRSSAASWYSAPLLPAAARSCAQRLVEAPGVGQADAALDGALGVARAGRRGQDHVALRGARREPVQLLGGPLVAGRGRPLEQLGGPVDAA
jgi:hypothetical protein